MNTAPVPTSATDKKMRAKAIVTCYKTKGRLLSAQDVVTRWGTYVVPWKGPAVRVQDVSLILSALAKDNELLVSLPVEGPPRYTDPEGSPAQAIAASILEVLDEVCPTPLNRDALMGAVGFDDPSLFRSILDYLESEGKIQSVTSSSDCTDHYLPAEIPIPTPTQMDRMIRVCPIQTVPGTDTTTDLEWKRFRVVQWETLLEMAVAMQQATPPTSMWDHETPTTNMVLSLIYRAHPVSMRSQTRTRVAVRVDALLGEAIIPVAGDVAMTWGEAVGFLRTHPFVVYTSPGCLEILSNHERQAVIKDLFPNGTLKRTHTDSVPPITITDPWRVGDSSLNFLRLKN